MVMIAAKDSIVGTKINITTTTEICAASIERPGSQPLIVCAVYRPPCTDQAYMEEMCLKIRDLHSNYNKSTIWIAGDMNLPDINWVSSTIDGNSNPVGTNQC